MTTIWELANKFVEEHSSMTIEEYHLQELMRVVETVLENSEYSARQIGEAFLLVAQEQADYLEELKNTPTISNHSNKTEQKK